MTDMLELACPLRAAAVSDPDLVALQTPGRQITFRELDEWVDGTASQLVTTGGPVALWMENDWRMVVLLLAAVRAGIVVCPLSTRLPAVDDAVELIGAQLLISERMGTRPEALLKRAVQGGSSIGGGVKRMRREKDRRRTNGDEVRTRTAGNEAAPRMPEGEGRKSMIGDDTPTSTSRGDAVHHPSEQPATIVFTSGSTGRPRAALHSFGNHYYSALGSNSNIAVSPGDRWLVSLPLYHVGGIAILFRCLLGRATVVLQENHALPDAAAAVTHLSLVATQLLRLLRTDQALPALKAVLLGGSAIQPSLIDEAADRGLPIHTSYGMTEMASQVTTTAPGAARTELATSGRLLPYRELKFSDEGEILVRGRTRFVGFVEHGEIVEPFDEEGWYATGDVGFTEDGLLNVSGRVDNLFISGGENVMPEEIERVLTARPDIRQAVVVPVSDLEFGCRPVAFIDTGENDLDPADIYKWLGNRLPRFKIPVRFFPWPERNSPTSMKVDRAAFEREADKLMRG